MLIFGTETHSAVQTETENQTLWVEWTGKLHQVTQSCMQAWEQHWALQGSPATPNCTFLWRWQTRLSLSWHSGFSLWLCYFQIYVAKRQWHTIQRVFISEAECCGSAQSDFRAAGGEASLQYIGEGEPFWGDTLDCILSVHRTGSSNTHTSAGSSVTVPAGTRLFVCVHPSHAQLLHCCRAALPSRSTVLLSCSILIAFGYLSKPELVSWWNFWQAVNNRSIINSCQMGLKRFLFILPKR